MGKIKRIHTKNKHCTNVAKIIAKHQMRDAEHARNAERERCANCGARALHELRSTSATINSEQKPQNVNTPSGAQHEFEMLFQQPKKHAFTHFPNNTGTNLRSLTFEHGLVITSATLSSDGT